MVARPSPRPTRSTPTCSSRAAVSPRSPRSPPTGVTPPTAIADFAVQSVGSFLREGLDAWFAEADGDGAIGYAFHMVLADVNEVAA